MSLRTKTVQPGRSRLPSGHEVAGANQLVVVDASMSARCPDKLAKEGLLLLCKS